MALSGIGQLIWDDSQREGLVDRLMSITDNSEREQALQNVIGQWAMFDADAALEWTAEASAGDRKSIETHVGRMMMMSDPERGAEVILSHAETEEERSSAYTSAVSMWMHRDPNGAGEWLGQQPQGPELDDARGMFASNVARVDPESALAWAAAVTDEGKRTSQLVGVYNQWATKDPAAAEAGLLSSGLDEGTIEKVLEGNRGQALPSPIP
jgi:hypothetical protein